MALKDIHGPDTDRVGEYELPPRPGLKGQSRARNGAAFLFLIGFILLLSLVVFGPERVARTLYHPIPGLILIIVLVEYIVLKSTDRTRVYRLENARLRDRHRQQRDLLERAGELLQERFLQEDVPPAWKERADAVVRDIDQSM